MAETKDVIAKIRECADTLASLADALETKQSSDPPEPEISFTDLRGRLAERSRDGFTDQIKGLIAEHGAQRLSDIDPKEYADLLAEVEALT